MSNHYHLLVKTPEANLEQKGNQKPYLGSEIFRDRAYQHRQSDDPEIDQNVLRQFRPDINQITETG